MNVLLKNVNKYFSITHFFSEYDGLDPDPDFSSSSDCYSDFSFDESDAEYDLQD